MGLDMYLTKRAKNNAKAEPETVIYWRKANQIHGWFDRLIEEGIENCEYHPVSKCDLEDLLTTCNKVLANKESAPELLPVCEGFFFGGTNYDDWYFEDVAYTAEQIRGILDSYDASEDFFYRAWW